MILVTLSDIPFNVTGQLTIPVNCFDSREYKRIKINPWKMLIEFRGNGQRAKLYLRNGNVGYTCSMINTTDLDAFEYENVKVLKRYILVEWEYKEIKN